LTEKETLRHVPTLTLRCNPKSHIPILARARIPTADLFGPFSDVNKHLHSCYVTHFNYILHYIDI